MLGLKRDYRVYIGVMYGFQGIYWGYIGIMEKKMETLVREDLGVK